MLVMDWINSWIGLDWIEVGEMTVNPLFKLVIIAAQTMLFLANYNIVIFYYTPFIDNIAALRLDCKKTYTWKCKTTKYSQNVNSIRDKKH